MNGIWPSNMVETWDFLPDLKNGIRMATEASNKRILLGTMIGGSSHGYKLIAN